MDGNISVQSFSVHEKSYPVITLIHKHGSIDIVFRNKHLGEIRSLYVNNNHKRQGIGTALMKAAEDIARNLGLVKLSLTCRLDNIPGCAFYDKNNYTREGQLKDHYGPGRDLVIYSKFLIENKDEQGDKND